MTLANTLVPLTDAPAPLAVRLSELASVRHVVRELITLPKQRMAARYTRPTRISLWVILYSYPLRAYILTPKSANK